MTAVSAAFLSQPHIEKNYFVVSLERNDDEVSEDLKNRNTS